MNKKALRKDITKLDKAITRIKYFDWTQGAEVNDQGKVCLLGALHLSTVPLKQLQTAEDRKLANREQNASLSYNSVSRLFCPTTVDLMARTVNGAYNPDYDSVEELIANFNDDSDTQKHDVLNFLRTVKKDLTRLVARKTKNRE